MVHVAAGLAFQAQSLLFCRFGKFTLQRIFLSTISLFFSFVVTFASGECPAFAGFIEAYAMNCVTFTFRAVCVNFFRNVHVLHYQLPNKETRLFLYFMTYKDQTKGF